MLNVGRSVGVVGGNIFVVVCCECGDIMQNMCVCRIDERVFVHELRNRHIKKINLLVQ